MHSKCSDSEAEKTTSIVVSWNDCHFADYANKKLGEFNNNLNFIDSFTFAGFGGIFLF